MNDTITLRGCAASWQPFLASRFWERFAPHAFDKFLAENQTVPLMIAHLEDMEIPARGMQLWADCNGLQLSAQIPADHVAALGIRFGYLPELSIHYRRLNYDCIGSEIVTTEATVEEISLVDHGSIPGVWCGLENSFGRVDVFRNPHLPPIAGDQVRLSRLCDRIDWHTRRGEMSVLPAMQVEPIHLEEMVPAVTVQPTKAEALIRLKQLTNEMLRDHRQAFLSCDRGGLPVASRKGLF